MNFGANAGRTLALFSNHAALILKLSAVSFLICGVSLGLMAPVLFSGLGIVFLKLRRGEAAGFADLFTHVDNTLQLFFLGLTITVIAALGVIFIFLPVLIIGIWMYALFFMAYEGNKTGESLAKSVNAVVQNGFLGHLMASLVICFLNAAGAAFFVVGLVVTVPLTAGFLAFCYEDLKGN